MSSTLLVIAGPNGSGKSSIYSLLSRRYRPFNKLQFINPDEIAKEIHGKYLQEESRDSNKIILQAGKQAIKMRKAFIKRGESFGFETTFSGSSEKRTIESAYEKGYSIYIIFIGLEDPMLNVMRVKSRVENGGHSVPTDVILRRYEKSFVNVQDVIPFAGNFYLIDNSTSKFRKIATMKPRRINRYKDISVSASMPDWCAPIVGKMFTAMKANRVRRK